MLRQLNLKNFLLIREAHLTWETGFHAITGETGAGKSMMLSALRAVLGESLATQKLIGPHGHDAWVEATWHPIPPSAQTWLANNGWSDIPSTLTLSRRLERSSQGKVRSQFSLQGKSCTRQVVQALAPYFVTAYTQHHAQHLLQPSEQRHRLDTFGQHDTTAVSQAFQTLQQAEASCQHWQRLVTQADADQELLRYYVEELDALAPQPQEAQQLQHQLIDLHQQAQNQANLEALNRLLQHQGHEPSACLQPMLQAQRLITQIASDYPSCSPLQTRIDALLEHLDDAEQWWSQWLDAQERTSVDPDTLQARLQALESAARKHRISPDKLHDHHQSLTRQLTQFEQAAEALKAAQKTLRQAEQDYQQAALHLTQQRQQAAQTCVETLQPQFKTLGLGPAQWDIRIEPLPYPQAHGQDQVTFLFAANRGAPLQPMAQVASGGELSRLALLLATLDPQPTPTLIFDEIDTGMSGATAAAVGKLLQTLGQHQQIIAITHLAQVAAHADHHFLLEKIHHSTHTETQCQSLNEDQMINELARLLSGRELNEHAKQQAESLRRECQRR